MKKLYKTKEFKMAMLVVNYAIEIDEKKELVTDAVVEAAHILGIDTEEFLDGLAEVNRILYATVNDRMYMED